MTNATKPNKPVGIQGKCGVEDCPNLVTHLTLMPYCPKHYVARVYEPCKQFYYECRRTLLDAMVEMPPETLGLTSRRRRRKK